MGFKENLKAELLYSGTLVKELAVKTGIKKNTIDNYLSVRSRMPSADAAVRIARALGVTVEYLVMGCTTHEKHRSALFSPEVRKMAHIAEQLKPDNRQIALTLVASLKKHEDSKTQGSAG